MQTVYPAIRITDYEISKSFYVDGLRFAVDWEHRFAPHLPAFMQITRNDLSLYLTQHEGDCQAGGLVYLYVADVDGWYEEVAAKGVRVESPPGETIKGLRDFRVTDPDGNQLDICTRLNP